MFIEADNLGGRRMINCAVIGGEGSKETLISLEYLKKWNLLLNTFPFESIDKFVERKYLNKYSAYYTNFSNLETSLYQESRKIKEPSKKCNQMREEILKKMGKLLQRSFK